MLPMDSKTLRFLSRMGARGALGQSVYDLSKDGVDFFVLSADLARASGFDRINREFPDRCINAGIAEANMIGIATGLSRMGTPTIATTWATFASARVADQVRNYMGYMQANVKLVGMDSGFENNRFGYSHTNGPDIAFMNAIPGITILAPSDGIEIYKAVEAAVMYKGPVYIRLTGGQQVPLIHKTAEFKYEIGKAIKLREGKEVAFISNGVILAEVLKAVEFLEEHNISCSVIDMHTIKPLDFDTLDSLLNHQLIVTVEEHVLAGGLGSIIASYYASRNRQVSMKILCAKDEYIPAGSYMFALKYNGLDADSIVESVISALRSN